MITVFSSSNFEELSTVKLLNDGQNTAIRVDFIGTLWFHVSFRRVNYRFTKCTESVIDCNDDNVADGGQHVTGESVGRPAFEFAAVDVEDDGEFLRHRSRLLITNAPHYNLHLIKHHKHFCPIAKRPPGGKLD